MSIPPIKVVGGTRLFTFNTKTRVISEYITQDTKGFEISGTTIKNFDKVNSRCRNLRKPAEFFPEIFDRSPKQIDKAWNDLKTKERVPNGRINGDTILLRVMDR